MNGLRLYSLIRETELNISDEDLIYPFYLILNLKVPLTKYCT
jgi:hypothetical protein